MHYQTPFLSTEPLRKIIRQCYLLDEEQCVDQLLEYFSAKKLDGTRIEKTAYEMVQTIREQDQNLGGIDNFLQEYKLSSEEGIALMCLAEALLRIPDKHSSDDLIKDKIKDKDWASHIGKSDSLFVNASSWGLMLTGKFVDLGKSVSDDPNSYFANLVTRTGEPVLRKAMVMAMQIMGKQFVLAESIKDALKQAKKKQGYLYSYDMLGEAARTADDASRYFQDYLNSIDAIGNSTKSDNAIQNPGISVKLSALHPRYEFNQEQRVMSELLPRLLELCEAAASYNIGLTIDAEESERLEPSLSILQSLCEDKRLKDWQGLGFVIQAYQKRAPAVLDWIAVLAESNQRRIMIRLVKGAYWDTEIKQAQVNGLQDYPVYTQKFTTDVAYLYCVDKLLANQKTFYPLFATHNAHTVSYILSKAKPEQDYEFQCLHGMGEILYDQVVSEYKKPVRIYAPVGEHKNLLAYLVRRLLENGANSSFVNRLVDKTLPIEEIIANPITKLQRVQSKRHPKIPKPKNLYSERVNSSGLNLANADDIDNYFSIYRNNEDFNIKATTATQTVHNPATGETIGVYDPPNKEEVEIAVTRAKQAAYLWDAKKGAIRASILVKAAELFEENKAELIHLCMQEAGKTLADADSEVREAVDFLRYYALQASKLFVNPTFLKSPTGETNQYSLNGRGVFVCISPWNFPLAIYTGQVAAALAAGNTVLAKPAEQTPLIASKAVELIHQAGVPEDVLQLLCGDGAIGAALTQNTKIDGVVFTGSLPTAHRILQSITHTGGPIIPLIAETGGLNAMIADSSTLIEQLVDDCISSAFQSAGQRCSALRILYVQEEIYQRVVTDLKGAMDQLITGNTAHLDTDIGPIIDAQALAGLQQHIKIQEKIGRPIYRAPKARQEDDGTNNKSYFFPPALVEINGIQDLKEEVFGPILHIAPYAAESLDQVIDDINASGFGLTFGIHSRINSKVEYISKRIHAGNIYINRNIIGAVVGVQPFGGEGLSGTGPKAGGPNYLLRFANEKVISADTTAAGGNAPLLSL